MSIAGARRYVLQDFHYLGNLNFLWTPFVAGIAGRAEPDEFTFQYLLSHSQKGHPDYLARVVLLVDPSHGTGSYARATTETVLYVPAAKLTRDFIFKVSIQVA